MGLDTFDYLGDFKCKCKTCGQIIETGIVNISEHYVNCVGKGFREALMKRFGDGSNVPTLEEIEEIKKQTL